MQIAVDLDDERTGGALDMSARGDIDGGLVMVPAGFVEIEGVFFLTSSLKNSVFYN